MFSKINFLCLLLVTTQAFPCSTLSYEDKAGSPWVAKSFDFSSGKGYVFINKKNIAKKSLTFSWGLGKKWVSQYGSVTFNQVGRDFPFGGMNEAGLNMEIMWLDQTEYPSEVKRTKQINESQIIQYVLDTSTTTQEAIEKIREINLVPILAPVHYMICDVKNKCSVVEYLNQKITVTQMNKGKERILQNSVYSQMLNFQIRQDGSSERNSPSEMNYIFDNSRAQTEKEMVEKSFKNLEKVEQADWSRWQIVYNLKERKIWFRTVEEPKIKSINLNDYELDCAVESEESVIDINKSVAGDVKEHLEPFSKKINKELLSSFKSVPQVARSIGDFYTSIHHSCKK